MSIQRRILLPSFGTITNRLNQGVASDVTSSIMSCSSIFLFLHQLILSKKMGHVPRLGQLVVLIHLYVI